MEKFDIKDLSHEQVLKVKEIAASGYNREIYNTYFSMVRSGEDLAGFGNRAGYGKSDVKIYIGDSWFLMYRSNLTDVSISNWVATKEGESLSRTLEMMRALKSVFLENRGKKFHMGLRHNTSYWLFRRLVEQKLCKVYEEDWFFDKAMPRNLYKPEFNDDFCFGFEDRLEEKELRGTEEQMEYVIHAVTFKMTDNYYRKEKVKQKKKTTNN